MIGSYIPCQIILFEILRERQEEIKESSYTSMSNLSYNKYIYLDWFQDIPTNYTCVYLSTLVTSYRDVVYSFDVLIYYICVLNQTKLIFDARQTFPCIETILSKDKLVKITSLTHLVICNISNAGMTGCIKFFVIRMKICVETCRNLSIK